MSLQTDLQEGVAQIQTDGQLLHTIVHGDDQTTVTTEGGDVKSASKVLKDTEDTIQARLADLDATAGQLSEAALEAQTHAEAAEGHAQTAHNIAQALNLPADLKGHAGKLLAVNQAEDGYGPIESKAVFYGLRKDGATLIAETGEGTFEAGQFPVWMVAMPGLDFSVNENGHLLITM